MRTQKLFLGNGRVELPCLNAYLDAALRCTKVDLSVGSGHWRSRPDLNKQLGV
jgi:hypothetical protein